MQSIRDDEHESVPTTSSVPAKDQMEEEDVIAEPYNDPIADPEALTSNANVPSATPAPASSGGLTEEQRKLIEAKRQEVCKILVLL